MEQQSATSTMQDRLQRTRYFMGGYWTFLATGADTNGQFSLMEINLRKGLEPPRHTHTHEDESFHVIEGEIQIFAGDGEQTLKSGDFIHIPKGVTHHFKLLTDKVKMLCHLVPAGLEQMFVELSQPAAAIEYPPAPAGPPPAEWLQKAAMLQQQYGIKGIDNSQVKSA